MLATHKQQYMPLYLLYSVSSELLTQPAAAACKTKSLQISAHTDGGPRSRVCARETLRSAPHRHERKFFGAHVCRVTFKKT